MPGVSDGGRTYAFIVRNGFAFSPPSGEPLTAETFRFSIERALSPVLGPELPAIVGCRTSWAPRRSTTARPHRWRVSRPTAIA
jgi:ABC-type transport system substrate-binding protein